MDGAEGLEIRPDSGVGDWLVRWGELEELPRIVLKRDLSVVWANNAAHALLTSRSNLSVRNDVLHLTDRTHAERFHRLIDEATEDATNWCLPKTDGDGHIVFLVRRITLDSGDAAIGLICYDSGIDFSPRWVDLKEVLGLTGSECQIILMLLGGHTAESAAKTLYIVLDTVRTHIRNAYAKLGVTSREGLFYRLAPYRIR